MKSGAKTNFSTQAKRGEHTAPRCRLKLRWSDNIDICNRIADPKVARKDGSQFAEIGGKLETESLPDKIKITCERGEMAEWLKARASKACIP
jgi:hypothetical protein